MVGDPIEPFHRVAIRPRPLVALAASLALSVMFALTGCGSASYKVEGAHQPVPAGGVSFGMFDRGVRPRVGGLPYNSGLTLYETAHPDRLGHHSYTGTVIDGRREAKRGFVYCCRAGFLDVSHMRKSADLCRYAAARIEFALNHDWDAVQLSSLEPTRYIVRFEYPPFWKSLPDPQKKRYARELGIRIGQNLGNLMITWHEVITHYGYRATVVIPESQSAFTYDDTASHAMGVELAGRAMRDTERDWNAAMTHAIEKAMDEFGGLEPAGTLAAVDASRGTWWGARGGTRRHVEFGMDGHVLEPWIIPGFDKCAGSRPVRLKVPDLRSVSGRSFAGMYRVEILPNVWQSGAIRSTLPDDVQTIDAHTHMPMIIESIRSDYIRRGGERLVRPD